MTLLARREHSRLELSNKMLRHFDRTDINPTLDRLTDQDLQSDERFAQSFTRERMLRGYGPSRIEAELQQRGVADSLATGAIDSIPVEEGTSWRALGYEVLLKKFGSLKADSLKDKSKRLRFLQYRGFGELSGELLNESQFAD